MSKSKLEMLQSQLENIESGLNDRNYTYEILVMRSGICYWKYSKEKECPDFVKEFNKKLLDYLKNKIEEEKGKSELKM